MPDATFLTSLPPEPLSIQALDTDRPVASLAEGEL